MRVHDWMSIWHFFFGAEVYEYSYGLWCDDVGVGVSRCVKDVLELAEYNDGRHGRVSRFRARVIIIVCRLVHGSQISGIAKHYQTPYICRSIRSTDT